MRTLRTFHLEERFEEGFAVLEETLSDDSKAYSVTNGVDGDCDRVTELRDDCFVIDCYDRDKAYELAEALCRCACA
jgi:hypothetical protein